jgi:GNAT superfamily N-acetyltransferase
MSMQRYSIRPAAAADANPIRAMQERSLRALGTGFYSAGLVESFIRQVGIFDPAVLAEGHLFVAVAEDGAILGSAGWSRLDPAYERAGEGGRALHDPAGALVRCVFVDPSAARRGIGSALVGHVEEDAAAHGVRRLGLAATLAGLPLYRRLGYEEGAPRNLVLPDGTIFPCVDMAKDITPPLARAA